MHSIYKTVCAVIYLNCSHLSIWIQKMRCCMYVRTPFRAGVRELPFEAFCSVSWYIIATWHHCDWFGCRLFGIKSPLWIKLTYWQYVLQGQTLVKNTSCVIDSLFNMNQGSRNLVRCSRKSLCYSHIALIKTGVCPGACQISLNDVGPCSLQIHLPCDWPSTAWDFSEQETENGSWSYNHNIT